MIIRSVGESPIGLGGRRRIKYEMRFVSTKIENNNENTMKDGEVDFQTYFRNLESATVSLDSLRIRGAGPNQLEPDVYGRLLFRTKESRRLIEFIMSFPGVLYISP